MKTRVLVASFLTVGAVLFSVSSTVAKTASCPCSPCKCSPCTCGGGGSKSGGKHHDKEHGHDHGSSFGVGGTVDLSGVGHRNAEPDPFAAGGGEKPVGHTEEKRTAKHKEHEPKTSTFDDIKLTGVEGKGDIPPTNTFNVDNEQVEPPKFGWGDTKEKPNDKKDTEKKLTNDELDELWNARHLYYKGLFALQDKMTVDLKALRDDLKTLDRQSSPDLKKKADEYNKFLKTLEDTFAKSEEGKKAFDAWLKTYEKFYKTGAKIPNGFVPGKLHPFLSPYAVGDDMANKKYALENAERQLETENGKYQRMQNDAVSNNDAYQKLESGPDKDKAAKDIANEWASTNEAKEQMKKVQQAEKAYGDAKEAFKPYEKFAEEKKEASK